MTNHPPSTEKAVEKGIAKARRTQLEKVARSFGIVIVQANSSQSGPGEAQPSVSETSQQPPTPAAKLIGSQKMSRRNRHLADKHHQCQVHPTTRQCRDKTHRIAHSRKEFQLRHKATTSTKNPSS
ncbi:unnamed protein product [Caenorhabditis angaria]|uniref:Uncharacterized protein n=1 Tax=Caenorhabditis angaria TaxID=860376 RepID=A0A9P1N1L9_9PELO|nr:unnamed protein product [Caenorhabditis angaria]